MCVNGLLVYIALLVHDCHVPVSFLRLHGHETLRHRMRRQSFLRRHRRFSMKGLASVSGWCRSNPPMGRKVSVQRRRWHRLWHLHEIIEWKCHGLFTLNCSAFVQSSFQGAKEIQAVDALAVSSWLFPSFLLVHRRTSSSLSFIPA